VKQTTAVIAITSCTGFGLLHSIFTWPKLGAAAFVLGGASLVLSEEREYSISRWGCAAAMFALAHLSHGGSDFALIALGVLLFFPTLRPTLKGCVVALFVFITFSAPWMAYQKFYDPPGNRLLKMHLAGVNDVDDRGFLSTLADRYREIGWTGAWQNKKANFSRLVEGSFGQIFNFNSEREKVLTRRGDEFGFVFRALSFGNFAVLAVPALWFWLYKKDSGREKVTARRVLICLVWMMVTLTVWCILMFMPGGCVIHQGSLAPLLVVFSVSVFLVLRYSPLLFCVISCLQLVSFATTWGPPNPSCKGDCDPVAFTVSIVCALVLLSVVLLTKDRLVEQSDRSADGLVLL
jgi:hypothetical protein